MITYWRGNRHGWNRRHGNRLAIRYFWINRWTSIAGISFGDLLTGTKYSRPKSNSLSTISYHYISFNIHPTLPPLSIHVSFSINYLVLMFESRRMKARKVDYRKNSKISRGHGSRISGLKRLNLFYHIAGVGFDFERSAHARFRLLIIRRTREAYIRRSHGR